MSIEKTGYNTRNAILYAIPQGAIALLVAPSLLLAGIYAKYYGMELTTIATVMLVARLFDAITDPVIGYCSDYWRRRTGSRKPLILLGGLLLIPCSYCLFTPPNDVSASYFMLCYLAFYLSLTLFNIPYLAWANEFTDSSKDKTMVFSLVGAAGQMGSALFYLLPLMPFFISTDISPEILKAAVIVAGLLLYPGLFLVLTLVPDGSAKSADSNEQKMPLSDLPLQQQVFNASKALMANKPFLLFAMAFVCLGIAGGLWGGLFFIYVDSYLDMGAVFASISLWGMLGGLVSIPIWYRLSLLLGKVKAWSLGMVILAMVFLCTSLLGPEGSGFAALFMLNITMILAGGSLTVVALPLLCDVIDYGRLKDGVDRGGLYFSLQVVMAKFQGALGGAVGVAVIGWFGFDVNGDQHSPLSLLGLHLSMSWIPALLALVAMVCISFMPLTESRMEVVRRRLALREARARQ